MRDRPIRTKPDRGHAGMIVGGWLAGPRTYLWIGAVDDGGCLGTISGQRLYRLAKAIVRQFEQQEGGK